MIANSKEKKEMLEVVDENDNVIKLETREKIHKEELLHRDVHVWFITPKGEIIFQRRSMNKDTFPGKLDASVAGHVEPGMSGEETVIKECKEETGINMDVTKLVLLRKIKNESFDSKKNITHRSIDGQYAYLYDGKIEDLQVEKDNADGFEAWNTNLLYDLSEENKKRFIPDRINEDMLSLFNKAKNIFNL